MAGPEADALKRAVEAARKASRQIVPVEPEQNDQLAEQEQQQQDALPAIIQG